MLTRDPFRHGDQAPRHRHATSRRILIRAFAVTGAAVMLAGMFLIVVAASGAGAATGPLGATVARVAENAAQRITPSPAPLTRTHGSRAADRHVCRALAVFDAAGVPSGADLRNLAAAGMHATRAYRLADGQLIMAVVGHEPFYAADTMLQRLCGTD